MDLRSELFDVVLISNMTWPGDLGLRIAQEVRTCSAAGYRVGLVHLPSTQSLPRISPDVQACVREGVAEVIDPDRSVKGALTVVHVPPAACEMSGRLRQILSEQTVLVLDGSPNLDHLYRWVAHLGGEARLAPTNPWVRNALEDLQLPAPVETDDWRPIGRALGAASRPFRSGRRPAIGYIGPADAAQWPKSAEELARILPTDGSFDVCLFGRPPDKVLPRWEGPPIWGILDHGDKQGCHLKILIPFFLSFQKGIPLDSSSQTFFLPHII